VEAVTRSGLTGIDTYVERVEHVPHVVVADLQQRCGAADGPTGGEHQDRDRATHPNRIAGSPLIR
jgi:hypothetical protein